MFFTFFVLLLVN